MENDRSDPRRATARRCADGQIHLWFYGGLRTQKYTCQRCDYTISKADLKAATDA